MYIRRLSIENVRAIPEFTLRLAPTEACGWHVILGANGAGKSSVVRSLALALAGPKEAVALRQNWTTWQRHGASPGKIALQIEAGAKDVFTGTGRRASVIDATLEFSPIESSIGGPRLELKATTGPLDRSGEPMPDGSPLRLDHFADSRAVIRLSIDCSSQILGLRRTCRHLVRTLR